MEEGILYIVATPIGNLEDMTFRAVRTLKEVDLVAAEDTRTARNLLNHFEISKPVTSLFEHNEAEKMHSVIERLNDGECVALISEAGTPTISDPGFKLVRAAVEAGIKVVPIPGASAAVAAMSASGLPTNRFLFVGFLPDKSGKRTNALEDLKSVEATLIFYVSKYKIAATLKDMLTVFGERTGVLCRELTKIHEELRRGTMSELLEYAESKQLKGEITLLVEGCVE